MLLKQHEAGAVAEWSKALLVRENNPKPEDSRYAPRPGQP